MIIQLNDPKHISKHKTNANYESLLSDKVEKRVVMNLFYDSCFTIEFGLKRFFNIMKL